jgi:hypothetical protein
MEKEYPKKTNKSYSGSSHNSAINSSENPKAADWGSIFVKPSWNNTGDGYL